MGLFDKKKADPDRVALQNLVLGINEKKMEVSDEFLDEMTRLYVSKRMKMVNDAVESFTGVQDVRVLFSKYTYINALLDELEKIEPYHLYNDPVPSEYRAMLEQSKPGYVNQIITRAWRLLGYNAQNPPPQNEIDRFFEVYKSVADILPEESFVLLNGLHEAVYGHGINEEAPDAENGEDAAVNAEGDELTGQEEPIRPE